MTHNEDNDSAAVSRRNALKAGAALGVGAAAFAGPQIGVLGMTPAYAAVCSQDFVGYFVGCNNTQASCGNDVGFKPIGSAASPITFGGDGEFYSNFGNSGACPTDPAVVTVTNPSSVSTAGGCRVTVIVHQGNCGSFVWDPTATGPNGETGALRDGVGGPLVDERARASSIQSVIGPGQQGTVNLPAVACGGGGSQPPCNVFWSAVVECNNDGDCL